MGCLTKEEIKLIKDLELPQQIKDYVDQFIYIVNESKDREEGEEIGIVEITNYIDTLDVDTKFNLLKFALAKHNKVFGISIDRTNRINDLLQKIVLVIGEEGIKKEEEIEDHQVFWDKSSELFHVIIILVTIIGHILHTSGYREDINNLIH